MACGLYHLEERVATHWVSRLGNKFLLIEYSNHGYGGIHHGTKDLPKDEYPYTIQFEVKKKFKCCELCKCKK